MVFIVRDFGNNVTVKIQYYTITLNYHNFSGYYTKIVSLFHQNRKHRMTKKRNGIPKNIFIFIV
jgi:hypothetical protein